MARNARTAAVTRHSSPSASDDSPSTATQLPKDRFAKCLEDAAQSVFSTMCGMPLKRDDGIAPADVIDQPHVSGIISLTGSFKSNVILNLHLDVVFGAAEGMLGMEVDTIDNDVLDLVRELTNMVAGKSKERLDLVGVSLGLPTVVAGTCHRIALKSDTSIDSLAFLSPCGPLLIEYCVQNG